MSKPIFAIAIAGAVGIVAAYSASANHAAAPVPKPTSHANAAHPVVLELYQSQGCSSCPPANTVLNEVANRTDVLALNFAVTYWDQLGWKDSFARPEFTARQWEYARSSGRSSVQTPQLIVDGKAAILGSRKNEVEAAIAAHRPVAGAPEIVISGNVVSIGAGSGKTAKVWLVSYDPRAVAVPVRAGENGGRTLIHRNIVQSLTPLGAWTGKATQFPLPAPDARSARAILVQAGTGGTIVTARKI
jgi:hypothetical protein